MEFWEQISSFVRVCPICYGKSDRHRILCPRCARFAEETRYRQWARYQNGIPILSLFEWTERAHNFFKAYASALKGGGPAPFYQTLAADLLTLRTQLRKPLEKTIRRPWVIVPAPGHVGGQRDHAEELAWQIAQLAGAKYLPCLERAYGGAQKKRNLAQRWSGSSIRIHERRKSELDGEMLYIFVDDVVTTGSTAAYAHISLGHPPHFEIWTLFNRPRLRALN